MTARYYFKQRNVAPWAIALALAGGSSVAAAQELIFSASLDKTTANLGDPVTLTLTLSGDMAEVELPTPQFPEGMAVVSRSQSTQFSIRQGTVERSVALVYVLVPQQVGTVRLGPFTVVRHHQAVKTEPLEMTVKQPALPPPLRTNKERVTL